VAPDLASGVAEEFGKYQASALTMSGSKETAAAPELASDPTRLSYQVASSLHIHPRERQQLLEMGDVAGRLQQELSLLKRENRPARATIGPFSIN
jgi:ATP-dependent Lon protease